MVVRDSLDGANGSRVPAATTAPGQQTGSRPSHPPRALDAAQEGSEGDNSGGVSNDSVPGHPPHSRLAAPDWPGGALLPQGQELGRLLCNPLPL